MWIEDREVEDVEDLDENPELVERLYKLASKISSNLESDVGTIISSKDKIRERLNIKHFSGGSYNYMSILAVDSTWSIPYLELVMGSVAVIVSGYIIVAPRGLGSYGLSFVSLRFLREDLEGKFTKSLELSARVKEYVTAYRQLREDIDVVMLDGPLYYYASPYFYMPSKSGDVIGEARKASTSELASLASRALIDLLAKADKLGVPVVGVVKRVSSKLLLPKIWDIRNVAVILERYNDKLLASLILEPGDYMIIENYLENLREYLALNRSKTPFQRILGYVEQCLEAPKDSLQGALCRYMERTAIAFYRHKGPTTAPQATRMEIYPESSSENIIAYAMENTTENNVPAPIDYVDRYVRVDASIIRRLYQLLKTHTQTPEADIAKNLTNPQKRYIYEDNIDRYGRRWD